MRRFNKNKYNLNNKSKHLDRNHYIFFIFDSLGEVQLKPHFLYFLVIFITFWKIHLMKEDFQALVSNEYEQLETNGQQVMMMGSVLVGLNLLLMVFVGFYWTNPAVHQYISGKPL